MDTVDESVELAAAQAVWFNRMNVFLLGLMWLVAVVFVLVPILSTIDSLKHLVPFVGITGILGALFLAVISLFRPSESKSKDLIGNRVSQFAKGGRHSLNEAPRRGEFNPARRLAFETRELRFDTSDFRSSVVEDTTRELNKRK